MSFPAVTPIPPANLARRLAPDPRVSGAIWTFHPEQSSVSGAVFGAANNLYFFPWLATHAAPVNEMGLRATVAAGAGGAAKFGLWRADPVLRRPVGLPVAWSNTPLPLDAGTGNLFILLATTAHLVPGQLYFPGFVQAVSTPLATFTGVTGANNAQRNALGLGPANSPGGHINWLSQPMTFTDDIGATVALGAGVSLGGANHPEVIYTL